MMLRELLAFFGLAVPTVRALDEHDLRHAFKNHKTAMISAERLASDMARKQASDPRRSELRQAADQSTSTIDALVREMRRGGQ